jgi:hypothetical protein
MAMDTFWNELGLAVMPLLRELPELLRETKPAIDAVAWTLRNFVAFNHLMSAGEKILTGDLKGAAKEFELGQTVSQGTAAQAATAGGGGGLSLVIQGDVKLSKDYPLTDFLKDADTAARNQRVQSGVPS